MAGLYYTGASVHIRHRIHHSARKLLSDAKPMRWTISAGPNRSQQINAVTTGNKRYTQPYKERHMRRRCGAHS